LYNIGTYTLPYILVQIIFFQVFVPLLTNPKNQRNWPRVVADDVTYHVNKLKNSVFEIRGLLSGQTLLPMPDGIERVHEVEQMIIERYIVVIYKVWSENKMNELLLQLLMLHPFKVISPLV
jgi:hypothetical protein